MTHWYRGWQFCIQPTRNVHTLTTGTTLTLGSIFISGIVVGSWSSSSFISVTHSASMPLTWFPSNVDVTHVLLEDPSSPSSKSMLFCKTTTIITAVPSHDMNHGSIRKTLLSIKMITPSYRFTSLQISKPQTSSFLSTIPIIVAPLAMPSSASYTT